MVFLYGCVRLSCQIILGRDYDKEKVHLRDAQIEGCGFHSTCA